MQRNKVVEMEPGFPAALLDLSHPALQRLLWSVNPLREIGVPVSYPHLDVYKRQALDTAFSPSIRAVIRKGSVISR